MNKLFGWLEKIIPRVLAATMFMALALVFYALYATNDGSEAYVGDFSAGQFNDDWDVYINDDAVENVAIPTTLSAAVPNDMIRLVKTLPSDIHDGMSIMIWTSMEDIRICIDGVERTSYCADNIKSIGYYTTSAYSVADISKEDAGKTIEIIMTVKKKGVINDIVLSNGNNAWFEVIYKNTPLNVFAFIIVALGILIILIFFFLKGILHYNNSIFYLGVLMLDFGIWMFSESKIRQLFFSIPSLTSIISYLAIESIGAFVVMYFDAIQHKKYHKVSLVMEFIFCAQLVANVLLDAFKIVYMHDTLKISHIWMAVGIVVLMVNIVRDIISKRIHEYKNVAFGMLFFLLMAVGEISYYYMNVYKVSGIYVCLGLLALMVATIVQLVADVISAHQERESEQSYTTKTTLETIASAIDAKDEYTGGHSNRVGRYATILAREMMPEYGFTEEDIVRINYIGQMHDIGKIGVADPILNKVGKLTNEEFTLMKKHVDIGYELLSAMSDSVEGLLDGVRYHHERYDGNGYPDGLQGENIPLVARILCIADCYDAMTSNRVYRKRLSDEQVRNEFIRCRGTQFDPRLTDIFVRIMDSGAIKPDTVDGMETDYDGKILKSSTLEAKLTKDLVDEDGNIPNPEHIRMLCYILKLMEKKESRIDVFFAEIEGHDSCKEDDQDIMTDAVGRFIKRHDINIEYTRSQHVIALMDRTDEEISLFINSMKEIDGMQIKPL